MTTIVAIFTFEQKTGSSDFKIEQTRKFRRNLGIEKKYYLLRELTFSFLSSLCHALMEGTSFCH